MVKAPKDNGSFSIVGSFVERRSTGKFTRIICSFGFPRLTGVTCCGCRGGGRLKGVPDGFGFGIVGFSSVRCDEEVGPLGQRCVRVLTSTARATRTLCRDLRGNSGKDKNGDSFFGASTMGLLTTSVCF